MTTKPETRFWKKLKDLTPKVHWTRIESFSSPGIPDLHGVYRGEDGWNYSYYEAGGLNFIMVETLPNRALYIYSGGMARELSIAGIETEPLAILQYPWSGQELLLTMERFLHYRESCDLAT